MLNNGNVLCEIHRLNQLSRRASVTYFSFWNSKNEVISFLRNNNLESVNVHTSNFIIRFFFKLLYYLNAILCNKLRLYEGYRLIKIPFLYKKFEIYDIFFSFYIFPLMVVGGHERLKQIIVDSNDILSDRHDFLGFRKWFSFRLSDEFKIINQPNVKFAVISENDYSFYANLTNRYIYKLYYNNHSVSNLSSKSKDLRVGFIASDSPLNRRDLKKMLDVIREYGNNYINTINLLIAGSIVEYAKELGIEDSHLFRESDGDNYIKEFYDKISILIVPCGKSTGIKTKILESLNYNTCVITTKFGYDNCLSIFDDFIKIMPVNYNSKILSNLISSFNNSKNSLINVKMSDYNRIIDNQFNQLI